MEAEAPGSEEPQPAPESAPEKPAEPTEIGAAYAAVQDAMRRLRVTYADSLPVGEERVVAYLEALHGLAPSAKEARQRALARALATAVKIDPKLGWVETVSGAGSADDRDALMKEAKAAADPEAGARCLLALGVASDAQDLIARIRDPWRRVEFRAEICADGLLPPSVGLFADAGGLPPGDRRDQVALQAIDALLRGGTVDGLAEASSVRELILGTEASGCAELAIAGELLRGGKVEDGRRLIGQAEKLVPVDARTDEFLSRLALAEHLAGANGVPTARMVVDDGSRAATLLGIARIELVRASKAAGPDAAEQSPGL
jgi:hypothetical protein